MGVCCYKGDGAAPPQGNFDQNSTDFVHLEQNLNLFIPQK